MRELPPPATSCHPKEGNMKMNHIHPIFSTDELTQASPVPWTAIRLREAIDSWHDLPPARRRAYSTAINNAERILAAAESTLNGVSPWTCEGLNSIIWQRAPACFGLSNDAFRSMTSGVRQVLIKVGLHADCGHGRNVLGPGWQILYNALPTDDRRRGLVRFLTYLTLSGIEPDRITRSSIDEFADWCRTAVLVDDANGIARRAASNWAFARANVPGWPDVELKRSATRDWYTLPLAHASSAFQADVANFLGLLAAGPADCFSGAAAYEEISDCLEPVGPPKPLRPRSIQTRSDQIRTAYSVLVLTGTDIAEIASLRDLVYPLDHPRRIFTFLRDRLRDRKVAKGANPAANELRSAQLSGMADVLLQIGRHYVRPRLPKEHTASLEAYARKVKPEAQATMTPKNAERLRGLLEPTTFAKLLHLPGFWFQRARDARLNERDRALWAMYGTALEIALVAPLRRTNIIRLHLDWHLWRASPKSPIGEIVIPAGEIKNSEPFTWPVESHSAKVIELFIERFRPLLLKVPSRHLFPGDAGGHRNECEFASEISRRVERDLGTAFNMHLCRHFCVVRFLRRHPGQYDLVRRALGHRNVATTIAYYAGLEAAAAAKQINIALFEDRAATKLTAAAAFKSMSRHGSGSSRNSKARQKK
jgi:integrase